MSFEMLIMVMMNVHDKKSGCESIIKCGDLCIKVKWQAKNF